MRESGERAGNHMKNEKSETHREEKKCRACCDPEEQGCADGRGPEEEKEFIPSSAYLIASAGNRKEHQQELLYEVLGPVFFGRRQAENQEELQQLFKSRYGIDVTHDFYEGDEHYEEYLEAQQAIADGMSIYTGEIAFEESMLARLAEHIWREMEKKDKQFRRINTALDE